MKIGGTLLGSAGMLNQGRAAAQAGIAVQRAREAEAAQLRTKAGQTRAGSQRDMLEARRGEKLIQSRLQAVAAASGAGASDPTVEKLAGDIAAEGEYRALLALFGGEEMARALEHGADVRKYEGQISARAGKQRQRAAKLSAYANLLSGFSDVFDSGLGGGFFGKYGEGFDDSTLAPQYRSTDFA